MPTYVLWDLLDRSEWTTAAHSLAPDDFTDLNLSAIRLSQDHEESFTGFLNSPSRTLLKNARGRCQRTPATPQITES